MHSHFDFGTWLNRISARRKFDTAPTLTAAISFNSRVRLFAVWLGEPEVTVDIADLIACLSARAEGTPGQKHPKA